MIFDRLFIVLKKKRNRMFGATAIQQFFRYASVGIASNLILYLTYLALTASGLGHKLAMTILYVTGVSITFVANKKWSFKHSGMPQKAFIRYVIAYALGYLLNLGLLWFAVDHLHLPHQVVQAVAIVVVAISLFFMHKYWVFVPSERSSAT